MHILLVTRSCVFSRYLAASLHSAGSVDTVIVETGRPSWTFYRRKLSRVGLVNAVFQTGFHRWFHREGARHLPRLPLPPHQTVTTVNGYRFGAEDVVFGFGTSIIGAETLAGMPNGFLNLHTGWLPDYRGVKSEFWTLAARDYSKVGWTLHYMTPRLDEGDIVMQQRVPYNGENPGHLRANLLRSAVPAMTALVERVRSEGLSGVGRIPQRGGHYFTTPTLNEWRRYQSSRLVV